MHPKRPRHYAGEISILKSREERLAALNRVPQKWRSWVRELVEDACMKKKNGKNAPKKTLGISVRVFYSIFI